MKGTRWSWSTIVAAVLIISAGMIAAGQQRQSRAETLMGSALHQEEVEGNYEGAIAVYRQVIADRQVSRALAARAQYHIGLCYEKLGNSEARKAYEQTVRNYADQKDVAAQANARLTALTRSEQRVPSREESREDRDAEYVEDSAKAAAPQSASPWQLMVYDHQENTVRPVGELQSESYATAFSPDGKRLAVIHAVAPGTPGTDIAVFDSSVATREQVLAGAAPRGPVWSPDGNQIAYFSYRQESGALYRKASHGTGSEELLYRFPPGIFDVHLTDWSPDGRFLVFDISAVVWVLPLEGERKPIELIREDFQVYGARLSPGSRYLAYVSDESGRNEVHARAFDPSAGRLSPDGGRWKISGDGGLGMLQWRADGGQLYYLAPDSGVMAVDVNLNPTLTAGKPRLLFRAPMAIPPEVYPNDEKYGRISPDGQRVAFQVLQTPVQKVVSVAPEILAQYVGTYTRSGECCWSVRVEDNTLYTINPRGEKSVKFAKSDTYFYPKDTDRSELEFVKDEKGRVTHFNTYLRGRREDQVFIKSATDAKPAPGPQVRGGRFPQQLTVYDREGKALRTVGEAVLDSTVASAFSPDGSQIVTEGGGTQTRGWIFDLSTTRDTQLTVERLRSPVFSPDGRQIAYYAERQNYLGLYRKASNGTGREQLLYRFALGVFCVYDLEWSPDGRFLVIDLDGVPWMLPLTGERTPFELVREAYKVSGARFSPNNDYLAYVSDEAGRREVYVQTFDSAVGRFSSNGRRWKVSDQGGQGPLQWRRDGGELYYWAPDGRVMALEVTTTPAFAAGPPKLLFRTANNFPTNLTADTEYRGFGSISPDGQRFAFRVAVRPERKTVTVAPEILAQYTGTYVSPNGTTVVFTLEANQLRYIDATGRNTFQAESETLLFLRNNVQEGDYEFFKDDKGVVTHFINHFGSNRTKYTFQGKASPPAPERETVTVAPAILSRYVGTYVRADSRIEWVVKLEGNRLIVHTSNPNYGEDLPLSAQSETYFFRREPVRDTFVEFFKDDKGVVTHLLTYESDVYVNGSVTRGQTVTKWTRK